MILNVELENQNFLDIDFEDEVYITGSDQRQLWKVFRSLYYYFNKNPKYTEDIYGDNKIEIVLDDDKVSIKNNDVYFINSREGIYNQMIYKKGSLLFDILNSLDSDVTIDRSIEALNNESLKLEIMIQELLDGFSNNLKAEFQNLNYLDFLKNYLVMSYQVRDKNFPLEFMDTEDLMDEFLDFLEFKLKDNGIPSWLVLYNLDSFVDPTAQQIFLTKVRQLVGEYDLKLIIIGNNLNSVPITSTDIDKIVVAARSFHQLLPFDDLLKSVRMHYPNELEIEKANLVQSIKRIAPLIGNKQKLFISNKDLVLLKVVNDILGYETSFDPDNQLLTRAETKFLKD